MKMTRTFPKVWFATEQPINSQTRLFNFSDRGQLSIEFGELQFSGRKQSLRIESMQSIELIFPRVPWVSLGIGIGLGIALALVPVLVFFGSILPRIPVEFIFLVILMILPFLAILLPFVTYVQKAMLWIEITFMDAENELRRVYFLDASRLLGWGTVLDDTLRMYKELRSVEWIKAG